MNIKKTIMALTFSAAMGNAFSWGWVGPYAIADVSFETASKQIQFKIANPSNPSDANLAYTYIYDCTPAGKIEDGKMILSILLSAVASGKTVSFETENLASPTTTWQIRQLKYNGN